ncbi:MAG: CBS domain-containing protein [Arcobacter sp.]|uniref:CBS domain-containing protein n=1 Tax=uncultured Arcobacter sp. TaxID=165434 RepID=UPI000CBFF95A|nr:CBS domain-containing protein [uncultured Arcobacter sp.]PLY08611.1 MAG: CBS domain-containing protein [Arcobacter sp.]
MFAIYDNGSVGFRSTVDNLYDLKRVEGPPKPTLEPDDSSFQDYMNEKNDKKHQVVNAYKKIANIDTSERVYHVSEIMTRQCIEISNEETLKDAYYKLRDNNINQIPVLTRERKILGLINKKIILNHIIEDGQDANIVLMKKLDEIYFKELITTDPITDIRRVAKVMIDFRLDAIPVVDEMHALVGIVSKADIIRAVATIPKLQLWS